MNATTLSTLGACGLFLMMTPRQNVKAEAACRNVLVKTDRGLRTLGESK